MPPNLKKPKTINYRTHSQDLKEAEVVTLSVINENLPKSTFFQFDFSQNSITNSVIPDVSTYTKSKFNVLNNNSNFHQENNFESHPIQSTSLIIKDSYHFSRSDFIFNQEIEQNPAFFLQKIISILRNQSHLINIETAEFMLDYFYPQLQEYRVIDNFEANEIQLLSIEIICLIISKFNFSYESRLYIYLYRILMDLILLCRHSRGTTMVHSFRFLIEIWKEKANILQEESFNKLTVEFLLTFTPPHPLFLPAANLLKNYTIYGFDHIRFIKLLLRLKVSMSIQAFSLIDQILQDDINDNPSQQSFFIEYLFKIAVSKPIWTCTLSTLIVKYMNIINENQKLNEWCQLFSRRSLQWIALSKRTKGYNNRQLDISRALFIISQGANESLKKEILTGASTLIQTGKYPELQLFFKPSSYSQSFLDEIDVLDHKDDLKKALTDPQTQLRDDQIRRIEVRKNLSLPRESKKFYDAQILLEQNIHESFNLFYIILSLLVIIIVVIILML